MDRYTRTFTVRWGDCDMNGHVRNTIYSEYCIETRLALLEERGVGYDFFAEHHLGPVILREEIDYLREIRAGETVTVDFSALGLAPDVSRFKLAHDLWKPDGKQAAHVVLTGGWLDHRTRRLVAPPQQLQDAFHAVPRAPGFEELPAVKRRT
jgi:acyl-CoA thioester hydrolase